MEPPKVILAVITDSRPDMTLQCCVSLLHLQIDLMTSQKGFQADLRFYETVNDALNDLHVSKQFKGIFIISYSSGVPGSFATKAFNSDKDIVIGVHPMQSVDWDRVKKEIASTTEDLSHTGIVYNIKLGGLPDGNGYTKVLDIQGSDVMFVKRTALEAIVKEHPDVVSNDGKHSTFFTNGIYDGEYLTPIKRFVKLYNKPLYADVELQCTKCAPEAFIGVVGNRRALR